MDFEDIEEIGEGGFGLVYKAKNKLDGRFYAIKKIPILEKTVKYVDRLMKEVTFISTLDH